MRHLYVEEMLEIKELVLWLHLNLIRPTQHKFTKAVVQNYLVLLNTDGDIRPHKKSCLSSPPASKFPPAPNYFLFPKCSKSTKLHFLMPVIAFSLILKNGNVSYCDFATRGLRGLSQF
jgi:hypothetical protein